MTSNERDATNLAIAERWCANQGTGWAITDTAGRGGTAPVYSVTSPRGPRALKLFDEAFSVGERGIESEKRLKLQLTLGVHDCPFIVQTYDGGKFEDRLFLLMNRASGQELEKRLPDIPRSKIRQIVDQVAKACIYLRERDLCHRDLKSANIFVTEDFEQITVLDLSVVRGINDPIGIGTDQGGQLPVVATSRYSPPEYLFRLIDPGPALWHALDVYQLGGVLHDLIMREPMFQAEYMLSRENRYRFAWIVATKEPRLSASDVDRDLMFLARRALDKNWERRSALGLEDFLDDANNHRLQGMEALGLSTARAPRPERVPASNQIQQIIKIAKDLEEELRLRFRANSVTATHEVRAGQSDHSKIVSLAWNTPGTTGEAVLTDAKLDVALGLFEDWNGQTLGGSVTLCARVDEGTRTAVLALPAFGLDEDVVEQLAGSIMSALGGLAAQLMRSQLEAN